MTKVCPSCRQELPVTAFGRNRTRPDGLSFYCLACNRERSNRWYREHRRSLGHEVRDHSWIPDGFRWCPSCRQPVPYEDYIRSLTTASGFGSQCKACKSAADSAAYFFRRYGMTRRAVEELRAKQSDRCALCGEPEPGHIDHDHENGFVRALLCQRCNLALGLLRDDPLLMRAAADYVEIHRARQAIAERRAASAGASSGTSEVASRPGEPPVGSQRRPGRSRSTRGTGRISGSRRHQTAGEADG